MLCDAWDPIAQNGSAPPPLLGSSAFFFAFGAAEEVREEARAAAAPLPNFRRRDEAEDALLVLPLRPVTAINSAMRFCCRCLLCCFDARRSLLASKSDVADAGIDFGFLRTDFGIFFSLDASLAGRFFSTDFNIPLTPTDEVELGIELEVLLLALFGVLSAAFFLISAAMSIASSSSSSSSSLSP